MMTDSREMDRTLTAMAHQWDREQFVEQVETHLDRFFGMALRLTKNETCAEDLVADVMAKAWSMLDSLDQIDHFAAWFIRVMTNHYISQQRKLATRTIHEEYIEEPEEDDHCFSLFERLHQPFLLWWGNPEQEFLDELLKKDIVMALDSLPETYRTSIVLVDVEGLSYQEVAEILDVPIGTVRSRLARARGMLQKKLWHHALDKGLVDSDTQVQS